MFELPFSVYLFPQMRRSKLLRKLQKVLFIHGRVFKRAICSWKFLLCNGEILKNFVREALRPLPIKTLYQRHSFVTCNFTASYLLRGVVGCPTDDEFKKGGVVVEVIDAVVY